MNEQEKLLAIKHLSMKYGTKTVLNDISFFAKKGEFIAILGKNGEGKTTLLETIAGLNGLNHHKNGTITIRDWNKEKKLAEILSIAPQKTTQVWDFLVRDIVSHGMFASQCPDPFSKEVEEVLQILNIEDLADRFYSTLSGGEQQKVIIARSIIKKPRILLLDEPISFLDPKQQLQLLQTLKSLSNQGICVISVLHDLQLAANFASRILLLNNHSIFADGTAKETLTEENLKTVFEIQFRVNVEKNNLPQITYPTQFFDTAK